MRAGCDATNDAKRRVFFERNAVIATARVRSQPIHARHKFDQSKFGDLVIQATDLRLFKFNPAPLFGVFLGKCLDDFFDLAAGGNAALLCR